MFLNVNQDKKDGHEDIVVSIIYCN